MQSGYQVLTPLREPDGRIVFVNRGFIPAALKDRAKRQAGEPKGPVRVVGLLRLPPDGRPNWFLPDNRPDLNYWFWVDLPAMATADTLDHVALVLHRRRRLPQPRRLAQRRGHPDSPCRTTICNT